MKKGTIATILGIIGLLVFTSPILAYWDESCPCTRTFGEGECLADPSSTGCTLGGTLKLISIQNPSDPLSCWNDIRNSAVYYGEDDDYVYFKMTITDPLTGSRIGDPDGQALGGYPKVYIQAWIDAGCPDPS